MSQKDTEYINKCRSQIEKQLNWLDPNRLKQSDFQYLCDLVFEKTNVQLSLSTIKRFWDSSYNKTFQIGTLNAFALFLDYKNWHQFKEKNYEEAENNKSKPKQTKGFKKKNLKIATLFIIAPTLLFTIFEIIGIKNNTHVTPVEDSIFFTSKKSVKEGVPNTIIFNYDVSSYKADSLCIQLSWNEKEREPIDKNDEFYTCTYYYPGYHHAKLIVNENIVKEHNVHITTKDWLTLVRYEPDDVLPIYIRNKALIGNGIMHAPPDLLKLNNVNLTSPSFFVSYFNVREFNGLKGDDFCFETKIKNTPLEPELVCQNCHIFIYAEKGTIVLPISSKGCVSDIDVLASDIRVSGKTNDLSALGCDLSDWRNISGKVSDNTISISIDKKKVYEVKYNKELGKIKGWHYFFKGCGAVDYLNLYDSNKSIVYQDNFIR